MRTRSLLSSVLALVTVGALAVAAAPPEAPEGQEYVPASENVIMAIGCTGDGATCESTEYFLSKTPGSSSVGTTFTATPIGSAFYYADGESYSTQNFFSDETLPESYVLRAGEDLTGQVTLRAYVSGAELAVDSAVYVEITAYEVAEDGSRGDFVTLGEAEVEKVVMVPGDNVYEYSIDLPDELEGVAVTDLSLDLGQRGVNVLTSGFVDGEGASFFEVPTYELQDAA